MGGIATTRVYDDSLTTPNFPQVNATFADESDRSEIFRKTDVSVIKYESMTLLLCGTFHVLLEGSQAQTVIKHIRKHSTSSSRRPDFLDNLLRAIGSMEFNTIEEVKHFLKTRQG